ncbi:methyltransferase [Segniliparus rotundus DSM 44985]|uniref:Methyltransferase n=1 Tax=Segniliparus rotundus (strain ATCC BAA-972 / CDC 1076 / CIP 108378 / DSM 44985 / JCM 13578) TaxID=640132 RepID=D6ZD37_SEGRD|nr:16S rRNA (guanine(966)-N(2))-methyltransferase RsmD [Segniliparus rotundus]ADG99224.1 methyltransferase [Segniliparus rotundus DSM 44985]
MIRIVAGEHRGRRLRTPATGARPTAERVRAAMFSALGNQMAFDGARVLDLYAGSGALALEAISRGAAHAFCVDSGRSSVAALRANIAELDVQGVVSVRAATVLAVLSSPPPEPYDLVFADPPYDIGDEEIARLLEALLAQGWLAHDALLVLERSKRSNETMWPAAFDLVKAYEYGDTRVEFACLGV